MYTRILLMALPLAYYDSPPGPRDRLKLRLEPPVA
jgi:hypothetical protein